MMTSEDDTAMTIIELVITLKKLSDTVYEIKRKLEEGMSDISWYHYRIEREINEVNNYEQGEVGLFEVFLDGDIQRLLSSNSQELFLVAYSIINQRMNQWKRQN